MNCDIARSMHTQYIVSNIIIPFCKSSMLRASSLGRPLHMTSVISGNGIDDNVRLGHIASVDARQVMQQLVPAAAFPQAACFNNGICLKAVGYSRATLVAGESFEVDLHWTVQHAVNDDYIMFVHLLDHTGQAVAGVNAYPLEHAYRTYEWKPGETIITSTALDIPSSVRVGAYSFELGMYSPHDSERIPTMITRHRCGLPARLDRNMCRLVLQNCNQAATQ